MKYLCLAYVDQSLRDALTGAEYADLVEAERECVTELLANGLALAAGALEPVASAVTIRVRPGRLSIADGLADGIGERAGAFLVLEVRDLNEAIRLAARLPLARIGSIEVRPLRDVCCDSGAGMPASQPKKEDDR